MPKAAINGVEINYQDRGSGEPVVMIHGAASGSKSFADVASVLEGEYRLIIPDLRGMGASERVTTMPHDAWVRDLEGLLDTLELESAHLHGRSLGARICARFAIELPDRVRTLVVDAPIIAMEPESNNALNSNFSNVSDDSRSAANWREMHGDDWREVVETYFTIRNNPRLQEYLSVRSEVGAMSVPTLITRGDIDEPVHPLAHCLEWHQLVPSSWLWIVPDVGSSAAGGRPEQFQALFRRFVEQKTA